MDKEVLIDANILLEIFLKDQKSEQCKSFLRSLKDKGIDPLITDFLIYGCLLIIQSDIKDPKSLQNFLIFIDDNDFRILRPSMETCYYATEVMKETGLDFDDGLVVACMKKYRIKELVSFDKHFDKVKDIKMIVP